MYETFEREKIALDSAICYHWRDYEANSCIVFIHGLGGHPEGTWKNLPNLLMGTSFCRHKNLVSYSYSTSSLHPLSPKIDSLIEDLTTFCETTLQRYEKIYFITHSLGAVLTLAVIPILTSINQTWARKVRGHIMLGPALWGSLLGWVSPSPTGRNLKFKSKLLREIREEWEGFTFKRNIKSYVVFGSEDMVIKKNLDDLKRLCIVPKSTAKNHIKISKINSISEVTYRTVVNCLYEIDGGSHYDSRNYIKQTVFDSNKNDWEYDDSLSEFIYIPDFKIRIIKFEDKGHDRKFIEPWVEKFPDPTGQKNNFAILYMGLRVYDFSMIYTDGFRYLIPLPKSVKDLTINTQQYALGKIMETAGMYDDLDTGLRMAGITVNQ